MDPVKGPITRQGLHPAVGHYGFKDKHFKDCSFALHPSQDGVAGGAVTTVNCESLLPQLAKADHWEPHAPSGFWLKSGPIPIATQVDLHADLTLKVIPFRKTPVEYAIYRIDTPKLRRPARLVLGWWTFKTKGQDRGPFCRLALLANGRIGDASQCSGGSMARLAGGRWSANEAGVTLMSASADDRHMNMRFEGMWPATLTANNGSVVMVRE